MMTDSEFFTYVDKNHDIYVKRLADFVAIQGVSAEPEKRALVRQSVLWMKAQMDELGAQSRLEELGNQTLPDGRVIQLPPVCLAQFGDDPAKKTLVVYGHLDVQPAYKADGWATDPFVLTEKDGALWGRGASDDKGPVLAWVAVLEAFKALGREVPVNLRFVLEGMEESGSVGLPDLVQKLGSPGGYLDPATVDYVCISDNYYTGKTKPCITHGLRGNVYFHLEVVCSSKDMHSGVIGGSVHEAMTDLVHLMSSLVDSSGKILIDGITDDVAPLTDKEKEAVSKVEFDIEEYKKDTGIATLGEKARFLYDSNDEILMHRWRHPTLSLHGIEGAFSSGGSKTVIPAKVVGKFSIRIVPNMTVERVEQLVRKHVEARFAALQSPCAMVLTLAKAGMWWYRDPDDPNFRAASAATVRVHGQEPALTREGGSIPITEVFEAMCKASCVLIPIGASDDGAHSQNEKIDKRNYFNGIKTLGCYIDELAKLPIAPPSAADGDMAERKAKRIRRQCKKNLMVFGCECLDCQVP